MEEIKTLKFVCPECGSNELTSIESVITSFPLTRISEDGDLDYDYEKYNRTYDSEVICYECIECGYTLKNERGITIKDCSLVAEWVKKNCSQN